MEPQAHDKWRAIEDVLNRHYENPDIEGARIVCAAVAAHALKDYPPAWSLVIAPPGSMKTDLLESLRGLPRIHFVDELTPKTFISGKIDDPKKGKRGKPASLLHRIGSDGILITADFSTMSSNPKNLGAIVAQLRRIYDGNFSREFGSDENLEERSWTGRLTLLACGTPDVDKHYQLFQSLGERFVRVRWDRAGGTSTGLRAMHHDRTVAPELKAAVQDLLQPILSESQFTPVIHPAIELRIAALSELIALARSCIERDRYTREQTGIIVTEGNTRLPQQLAQIARGSALLDGRTEVNEADYVLVVRAAFDSLLPVRFAVLKRVAQTGKPYTLNLPHAAISRAVEDLQAAGVLTSESRLTDAANRLLTDAGLNPNLFVMCGTECPASLTNEQVGIWGSRNSGTFLTIGPTGTKLDEPSPDGIAGLAGERAA